MSFSITTPWPTCLEVTNTHRHQFVKRALANVCACVVLWCFCGKIFTPSCSHSHALTLSRQRRDDSTRSAYFGRCRSCSDLNNRSCTKRGPACPFCLTYKKCIPNPLTQPQTQTNTNTHMLSHRHWNMNTHGDRLCTTENAPTDTQTFAQILIRLLPIHY